MSETNPYEATGDPAEQCVFCEHEVDADAVEIEVVTSDDYMDTNLGDDVPGRRVALCTHHHRLLRNRTERTTELVFR